MLVLIWLFKFILVLLLVFLIIWLILNLLDIVCLYNLNLLDISGEFIY